MERLVIRPKQSIFPRNVFPLLSVEMMIFFIFCNFVDRNGSLLLTMKNQPSWLNVVKRSISCLISYSLIIWSTWKWKSLIVFNLGVILLKKLLGKRMVLVGDHFIWIVWTVGNKSIILGRGYHNLQRRKFKHTPHWKFKKSSMLFVFLCFEDFKGDYLIFLE